MHKVSMIVAYGHKVPGKGFPIGQGGDLSWGRNLPTDTEHYRGFVADRTVIAGRRTLEPIIGFLQAAQIIMLSSRSKEELGLPAESLSRFVIAHSLDEALELAEHDVAISGGASVYREAAANPAVTQIIASEIDASFEDSDTFFTVDLKNGWHETSRVTPEITAADMYGFDIVTSERVTT